MIPRRVEMALWMLTVAIVLMTGTRVRREPVRESESPSWATGPAVVRPASAESLVAASHRIVERDPFRLERRPSAVAYTPVMEGAPPQPPAPPKPTLVVTGIVGGPPWEALVEGMPGRAGSVLVRRGDVFGDSIVRLSIKRVGQDTVVVVGMDTTWKLTVRRAWE